MDSSNSSTDDDCNIYISAAQKLKELNSKEKKKSRIAVHEDDDEEDDDDDDVVCQDSSPDVVSKEEEAMEDSSKDETSTDELEEMSSEESNLDKSPITLSDNDSSDIERLVRSERKRKAPQNPEQQKTIPANNRKNVDESIENLLDDSYDNSFQLSQEDDDYVVIGSPPPAKKLDDDYEVGVKVLWKSNKMERFQIRRHETFQKIFMHFAKLEGVPEDQIRITKKGKRITALDTPITVDWSIVDIFDGGVVSAEVAKKKHGSAQDAESENSCQIKIQSLEKGTLNFTLKKTDTFEVLLKYCSEKLGVPESKIKFYFDGELVDIEETPDTLDLDDENCFDMKISQ
ncbi:uncharacterized protein CG4449 [Copidosoma floridanum]|uniref:uncharacterized protein CG4449 n=1 Tax=Copidosoma floridanum TaxID=29053 RepID=UPI0006C94C2B|nr:uncharacterized protein CG4449 [Copidosoma floridanum]